MEFGEIYSSENCRQDIPYIVGHSSSEGSDSLEFLGLSKLFE